MATVKLWEGIIDIPTYPIGVDDPYPPFQRTGNWWIYPYTMQDDLLDQREEQSYPGVFMENEYLRLSILPTLGGRLYSVFDKTADAEVFYRNHVFKPGLIALRGAWISGGIEFNFPQGHTVSTVSPVKCVMRQNDDGSATVIVGDIDRVSRMRWSVSLSLFPGRAAFQVGIRLENPTQYPQRYYFWSNAAVPATPRMQFIYPMIQATTGSSLVNFPMHEGKDLGWYVSHPHAIDLFAKDPYGDYFGCYDHDAERGVVNIKDRRVAWGQKFFTWGTAESGQIWQTLLTDEDGQYCEIQSGRFATQGIHRMMAPHAVETWQETWWPLKQMGGFCYANEQLALQIKRGETHIHLAMNASEPIQEAQLILRSDDAIIAETPLDISPETPFSAAFEVDASVISSLLQVCVLSSSGEHLLDYGEQKRTPKAEVPPEPTETVESLCLDALQHHEEARLDKATQCYQKALELDPGSTQALCGLAEIACKRGLLDEAQQHLFLVLRRNPEDPLANWYLGTVLRGKGDLHGAAECFHRLERFPGYAHLGLHSLGELALMEQNWSKAAHYLGNAFQYHMQSTQTVAWMSLSLRRQQQKEVATGIIESALEQDSLSPLLHAEQCFCYEGTSEANEIQDDFRSLLRGDPQTYLEVAMQYVNIGAWQEAIDVLRIAVDESPGEHSVYPMVYYTLGFCHACLEDRERMAAYYRLASLMSRRYVFPHRGEMICILEHALQEQPEDACAYYYLGNLYMARDRVAEALSAWKQAIRIDSQLTEAHRNIALCLGREEGTIKESLDAYQTAIQSDPTSYRLYLEWEQVARSADVSSSERLAFLDAASPEVLARSEIAARRVRLLVDLRRFEEAIKLLSAHTFRPWEGAHEMRRLYVQAHLGAGEQFLRANDYWQALCRFEAALEYPTNIGVGKPDHPNHAEIYEWAARAADGLGDTAKASVYRRMAAEQKQ